MTAAADGVVGLRGQRGLVLCCWLLGGAVVGTAGKLMCPLVRRDWCDEAAAGSAGVLRDQGRWDMVLAR